MIKEALLLDVVKERMAINLWWIKPLILLLICAAIWWWHAGKVDALQTQARSDGVLQERAAWQEAERLAERARINQQVQDQTRGQQAARAHEKKRDALDDFFKRLEREARHDAFAAVDAADCVLPADRLRRWNEANAGGALPASATTREPVAAPQTPATSGQRADAGAGGEPPRGGAGLPRAGEPVLPVAGLPEGASL